MTTEDLELYKLLGFIDDEIIKTNNKQNEKSSFYFKCGHFNGCL